MPGPGETLTRRRFVIGAMGVTGVAAAGGAAYAVMPRRFTAWLRPAPDPFIPDAAEGLVRLETVRSEARNQDVNLFTAVPAGHGDGAGLPVVVVLHGGTATAADLQDFGLGRFLTAAVDAGAEPFVLAGADGGLLRWEPDPSGDDDPRQMVLEEMPRWLTERGFDARRRALWGWSMGGYGVLSIAEAEPTWPRAVATFSPAVGPGDGVFAGVDVLASLPLGIWCGTDDDLYDDVVAFVDALPEPPEIASYGPGAHTRVYWNDQTIDAFTFLASHLG